MTPIISTLFALVMFSTISTPTFTPITSPALNQAAKTPIVEASEVSVKIGQPKQYEKSVKIEPPENSGQLATVSAYTSREIETDQSPCISANGANICDLYAQGTRICAANGYPFGTILHIDGLGDCVVMDRMARKYGKGNVDWYFGYDLHGALQWGRQKRIVTVK